MAIENFEGKNIQDTFQRVVQTDGTNQLADGTGSIFIPVSSSHAITASHALFAVSVSHEITFELSSSHAVSADTASFATNFTASGNISASGTIFANQIETDQLVSHIGDANTGLQFASDTVVIQGNDENIAVFKSTVINFTENLNSTHYISGSSLISDSHITASGNISASGDLTANNIIGTINGGNF